MFTQAGLGVAQHSQDASNRSEPGAYKTMAVRVERGLHAQLYEGSRSSALRWWRNSSMPEPPLAQPTG